MKAIAQPKTAQILDRINALQATTSHYFNSSQLTPLVREWREIRNEIDSLMKVDACAAWETAGAWKSLAGDVAGTEAAFANSVRLGNSGSNRENWMRNRLNLACFLLPRAFTRLLDIQQQVTSHCCSRTATKPAQLGKQPRLSRGLEKCASNGMRIKSAKS
ncbi:hypothetical protein SBC1_12290 [Caballeronia sp. SBC1]|nr:hypothetical protein SBC2_13700 [Caballeronia sp. SBC2]QIN61243.1 hypothetical protein SBC1_12290 [Caballeronia sp. SBC1]